MDMDIISYRYILVAAFFAFAWLVFLGSLVYGKFKETDLTKSGQRFSFYFVFTYCLVCAMVIGFLTFGKGYFGNDSTIGIIEIISILLLLLFWGSGFYALMLGRQLQEIDYRRNKNKSTSGIMLSAYGLFVVITIIVSIFGLAFTN